MGRKKAQVGLTSNLKASKRPCGDLSGTYRKLKHTTKMADKITQNGCFALKSLPDGSHHGLTIVVQVLSYRFSGDRAMLEVTDGNTILPKIVLVSQLTSYVTDGLVRQGTILKVTQASVGKA